MGQMRKTKKEENKFRSIQKKLTDGLAFTMMKVSFINDAKKQFIHSPIQIVVGVGGTQFSPLLNSKDSGDTYPEPPATIADCSRLTSQQFFDITALVKTVSKHRSVRDTRVVFDVEIMDGSKTDDRVRIMPLTVYTDRPALATADDPALWTLLNEASKHSAAKPVSFFRIKGAQDEDGTYSFTTTKNSTIVSAATTSKGRCLVEEAPTLLGLTDTDNFAIKKFEEWVARDFTQERATETMCGLFATIANTPKTGVDALDQTDETFWQLNWVRVEEPPVGSNIRTIDGKRLWFPVTVRDCTGILSLYIS